jgi:hypothetical protein
MSTPGWKRAYDRLERAVTPHADAMVRSHGFAQVTGFVTGTKAALRGTADSIAARAWHLINLPAGTDVQRLRQQVGALDREVRLLSHELRQLRSRSARRRPNEVNDDGPA